MRKKRILSILMYSLLRATKEGTTGRNVLVWVTEVLHG